MKSTLSWVLAGAVVGVLSGAALGYWEARPWAANANVASVAKSDGAVREATPVLGAKAVAPETTFHFGNMESGSKQHHAFPIRNEGGAPLTINFVSHTCKCTEVRLDGKLVEPGAVVVVPAGGAIEAQLEWAAKVPPGPFRHGATFTTTDPTLSRLELTVEGEIVASTMLQPSQLSFGSVRVGESSQAELVVMSFIEPEVKISAHEVLDEELAKQVTLSFEPAPRDKLPDPKATAGVKVVATYTATGALGPFVGSLKLDTNIQQAAQLEVPIYGVVKGDISIYGNGWSEANGLLRMGAATAAAGGKSQLFVNIRGEYADDTKLSVESVKPDALRATLGQPQKLRDGLIRVPLEVSIPPGTRPMVYAGENQGGEGEIILATTHPVTPKVRLRVTFTVQP
jgi:hypothetical protein